jgi:enoyl-CoA hydratase
MPSYLQTEQRGRVMIVRLVNPPMTLVNRPMLAELYRLVRRLEQDSSIGAVVVTGSVPDVFAAHYDVAEIIDDLNYIKLPVPYRMARVMTRLVAAVSHLPGFKRLLGLPSLRGMNGLIVTTRLFGAMNASSKVYIAAINGLALGTGTCIPLACDLRVMADGDYHLGLIEMNIGFLAGIGGAQRMVRAIGVSRAMPLLLEGTVLTPAQAADIGLVHQVVAPDRLLDEAVALGQRLAQQSPAAIRETKRSVYDAGSRPLGAGLAREAAGLVATLSSDPARRAVAAYQEELNAKRPASNADVVGIYERMRHGELVSKIG